MEKEIQQKCDDCTPCEVTGKNTKPQLPMTEITYLPPTETRFGCVQNQVLSTTAKSAPGTKNGD